MKKLELKFNMEDWIKILSYIRLTETDPEQKSDGGFSDSYKKEIISRNKEVKIISQFLSDLKKKKNDNKDAINKAYGQNEHPFPELLELPETKNGLIARIIYGILEKIENKDYYYHLLENNKQPNYQELTWRMSGEKRRDNVVLDYDIFKNEDSMLHVFQNAIALCPPSEVQSAFEFFIEEYSQLEKIDSKKKTKEKKMKFFPVFTKQCVKQICLEMDTHAQLFIICGILQIFLLEL